MKTCPKCSTQNEESAKFCSVCGASLVDNPMNSTTIDPATQNNQQTPSPTNPYTIPPNAQAAVPLIDNSKIPFYQKNWFVILWLIIFFPVGLILMWVYKKKWKLSIKIILTVIFALIFIICIAASGDSSDDNSDNNNEGSISITTAVEATEMETTTTTCDCTNHFRCDDVLY